MSLSDLDPDILSDFLIESGELLEQLDHDLVALEQRSDDAELLDGIFRALHTIKGSGSFLGLTHLTEVTHAAEDALNKLRKRETDVTVEIMNDLLAAADVVGRQLEEVGAGKMPSPADSVLVESLQAVGTVKSTEHNVADSSPAAVSDAEPGDAEVNGLALNDSKLDLLPFMIDDLSKSLIEIESAFGELDCPKTRPQAAAAIQDITQELCRSVDFFEVESLIQEMKVFDAAVTTTSQIDNVSYHQLAPRLLALLGVFKERTDALAVQTLIVRPTETLLERIGVLSLGNALEGDAILSDDANAVDAARVDGLIVDQSDMPDTASAKPGQAKVPADEAPDLPEIESNAAASKSAKPAPAPPTAEQTIRVDVSRLEQLLNLTGELVLQKNRVGGMCRRLCSAQSSHELAEEFQQIASDLDRVTSELQAGVMKTRLQPLNKLFSRYPRVIRDLAKATGKQIELDIVGGDTEVDKSVLELLADPMVHIMRNSADHGLEDPEQRLASGKSSGGTIRIEAAHEGSHVTVRIGDDGRGIDPRVIAEKIVEKGLASREEVDAMPEASIIRHVFAPGFSTRQEASDLSGRGVGMDVVNTNIAKLSGIVDIESTVGQGTRVTIKIPLTLAIMQAMMIEVADSVYAVPLTNIIEIVQPEDADISTINGQPVLRLRDMVTPLVDLQSRLDCGEIESRAKFAVIVGHGAERIGLMVHRLIGQQEIVAKPLDDLVERGQSISGATVRADGGVSLILDIASLLSLTRGRPAARLSSAD